MARRRYISTKLSTDAKVNKLIQVGGDFAALLYTWMIPHAEDDCRLTGDPDEILMTVIPGRRDKTADDIRTALTFMQDLELIIWNEAEGYVEFPSEKFYSYQTYIAQDKRKTPPSNTSPDSAPENAGKRRESPQKAASVSPSPSFSSSSSPSVRDIADLPEPTPITSMAPTVASAPSPQNDQASRDEKPTNTRKPRAPDPYWDTFVEYLGHGPSPAKRGAWNKAIADIKKMGGIPEEIPKRFEVYKAKFADCALTPSALAGLWPDCKPPDIEKKPFSRVKEMTPDEQAEYDRLFAEALNTTRRAS